MLRWLGYGSWALTLACGSTSTTAPAGGGGANSGDSDCAVTFDGVTEPVFDRPTHGFRAYAGSYWFTFDGAAFDGSAPSFHDEAERQGFCRLLTYEPAFCDPGCTDGKICFDGTCVGYPTAVSAGALEVRGAGSAAITLQPNEIGHYSWSTEAFGFDAIDAIAISATGGVAPPFELAACLTEPPRPKQDWSMLLEARPDAADIVLQWSNPLASARVYLRMTTGIGTHGGISPVEIECEGPDRGTLTIPGSYLDALYEEGWACGECGGNELVRYHAVQTGTGVNAVELRTESGAPFWFRP